MNLVPLLFLLGAWAIVLGLTGWCFWKLMKADASHEHPPPPGTSL